MIKTYVLGYSFESSLYSLEFLEITAAFGVSRISGMGESASSVHSSASVSIIRMLVQPPEGKNGKDLASISIFHTPLAVQVA
jgi:hypothetical protein